MTEIMQLLTAFWLACWALWGIVGLARGVRRSILFLLVAHFGLCGFPLILDLVVGMPTYAKQPGFYIAAIDEQSIQLYCLYVSLVPVVWWLFGRGEVPAREELVESSPTVRLKFPGIFRLLLYLGLISPLIALLFAPEPGIYLTYGWVAMALPPTQDMLDFHNLITLGSTFSVISAASLLSSQPRLRLTSILPYTPWLLLALWLNGKRYLLVVAVFILWLVFWERGRSKGAGFVVAGLSLASLILILSYAYQDSIRDINLNSGIPSDWSNFYDDFRINYGRDSTIKMALYAEANPNAMRILEFRGQSILFYATMYVPRMWWPEKPYPYPTYFTSAMLLHSPRQWGWGMTTSWLDEAIANFSWFGLLLGPIVPVVVCRIGDHSRNRFTFPLTCLIGTLLLSVSLAAFAPLVLVWFATIVRGGHQLVREGSMTTAAVRGISSGR